MNMNNHSAHAANHRGTDSFPMERPHFARKQSEKMLFSQGRNLWYHYTKTFGYNRNMNRNHTAKLAHNHGLPIAFVEHAINLYLTH
ncbi:hypothetical protein [Photorhabdus luminescens]|uniref:Uncharacterized protein n=1 Tax=Photorhabdus luminescens subsp. mexicana TaxID=2100167 RepID=A0A4R4IYC0_PHOLU|nr:hypothetical protein [Photorhabdus luminescens]TDB45329.1 hypothetical protein C5468_21365 [Photorhabdus luminescens subsp. mexicana]